MGIAAQKPTVIDCGHVAIAVGPVIGYSLNDAAVGGCGDRITPTGRLDLQVEGEL